MGEPSVDQAPVDPEACPACTTPLGLGHMVCVRCGATIVRTRYPMSGDWNRRVSGIAVSGWGWPLETGSEVHVLFDPRGLFFQHGQGQSGLIDWGELLDISIDGPGAQHGQDLSVFPILDLANPKALAINMGLSMLASKVTSTVAVTTFLVLTGVDFELTIFVNEVEPHALRWQLAPAFATWRRALHDARKNGQIS